MDLAADPQLRALVEAARAWGISPKRLLGWEPKQTTVYEYDDLGRVVCTTTTVDVEWDGDQRGLVFALQDYEEDCCPGGKHLLAETTLAENEDCYVAGPAVRCHFCTATEQASKAYEDSPAPSALLIPIQLREG